MSRKSEISALTGLRGFGALWVFLSHINLFYFGTGKGIYPLTVGYAGVDLFFLLSGFVMCYAKWDVLRERDWQAYAQFLMERVIRLYPTNAVVLVLFALAAAAHPGVWDGWPAATSSAGSFVGSLLLLQSWLPLTVAGWNIPGWSVSSEIGAYVALPLVLFCARRVRGGRVAMALAALLLAAFVMILVAAHVPDLNVKVKGGLLRLGCEFSAGSLIFVAWRDGFRLPVMASTLIAGALFVAALIVPVPGGTFMFLPAFAILLLLCARGEGPFARFFATAPAIALGRISYSLYLVHWPVLMFWTRFVGVRPFSAGSVALNAALVVGTIALAAAIHAVVEAPSHRLARRLGHRRRALVAAA